jgi:hypothetical protein
MFLFVKISLIFAGYFVLQDLLGSLGSLDFPTGKASIDEVSKCSGDVSIFLINHSILLFRHQFVLERNSLIMHVASLPLYT